MNFVDFIFDGQKLSQYSSIACCITDNSSGATVVDVGSELSFDTINNNASNSFKLSNAKYNEAYTTTFQITKLNCDDMSEMSYTDLEIANIRRWLVRKEYKEFKPIYEDGDFPTTYFIGSFSKVSPITLGRDVIGFECSFTSDSACGYHDDKRNVFSLKKDETFSIYDTSDVVGNMYPKITIKINKTASTFELYSEKTGKTTQINNVINGEIITLDCKHRIIQSSVEHDDLADDFNYVFPIISNDIKKEENIFRVSERCNITFEYRPTANVGLIN